MNMPPLPEQTAIAEVLSDTHNARFVALMNQHMPKWRSHQDSLNRIPVRHEQWSY